VTSAPSVRGGEVYAAQPDGSDGWYIGGAFTKVGGAARNGIAHLLSDGSVDLSWNPSANGPVTALAVSGSTVYAGGEFTSIGGQPRNRIAALDAAGSATSWNPNANGRVTAITVSGSTVYAGGVFTSIGGQVRNRIAAIDLSGSATSWNPNADNYVEAITVSGSTVYAGGDFTSIGGQVRNGVAALDPAGNATSWNPNANGAVFALAVSGSTVYAAGDFTSIGGQLRDRIAALDSSGSATSWNPAADGNVQAVAVSGSTVYAGGDFTSIGGQVRNGVAALDTGGNATSWNPNPNSSVFTLAVSGSSVYAGGTFNSVGGVTRNRIAELDLATGRPTSWNPDANGNVWTLATSGSTVFAGGDFTSIGGQTRNRIAALDSAGNPTPWNPSASSTVLTLVPSGSTVYAGGDFTSIGGQPRNRIAALDLQGGATSWNPNASWVVQDLAVSGSTIYAVGEFTSIGGQSRSRVAALDSQGSAASWNPNANSTVDSVAVSGTTVYVGGFFTSIGGQARSRIAAIDSAGNATGWNPNANAAVRTLATSGSTVYAGGAFTSIGGQARSRIAAIDSAGNATGWDPSASDDVHAMVGAGSTVYVGGRFAKFSGNEQPHIGLFVSAPIGTAPPVLSGTVSPGQTISATRGSWDNDPAGFTYQWRRCDTGGANCGDIAGATASSYVVVDADVDSRLRVRVTATNLGGSAAADSAAATANGIAPSNAAAPSISGTAHEGETLNAQRGAWDGTTPLLFAYQWQRCTNGADSCADVADATAASYSLSAADVGSAMRVRVTAANSVGTATSPSATTSTVAMREPTLPTVEQLTSPSVDLQAQARLRIDGARAGDRAGVVATADGDFNGDGVTDIVVGSPGSDPAERLDAGAAYVVFGRSGETNVDLASPGTRAIRIDGPTAGARAGEVALAGGDLNGDGNDDLVVGAPGTRAIYVVFGANPTQAKDLAALGGGGYRILPPAGYPATEPFGGLVGGDRKAPAVAAIGDVNGDDRADLLVGLPADSPSSRGRAGSAYVVFGKSSTATLTLGASASEGYRIAGAAAGDKLGSSVAVVGDVNDDGFADQLIGAPGASLGGASAGAAYVTFGKSSTTALDLAALGTSGYRVDGRPGDLLGMPVSSAADVDQDGATDLLLGAQGEVAAYVVFGLAAPGSVSVDGLDGHGYPIMTSACHCGAGFSLARAGDMSGDGVEDAVVGSPFEAVRTATGSTLRPGAGRAFIVFGKPDGDPVSLDSLGPGGRALGGAAANDQTGFTVGRAEAGIHGGLPGTSSPRDLVVGAPAADNNARGDSGSIYVATITLDG
jgi:hypothetical protein